MFFKGECRRLVGGLEHEFYVSIYWECHHPNWRTPWFFRGIETTNQTIIETYWNYPLWFILIEKSSHCWAVILPWNYPRVTGNLIPSADGQIPCPRCCRSIAGASHGPRAQHFRLVNGLVYGKIYRKPWIFPWRSWGFPVFFSLKPIHWVSELW